MITYTGPSLKCGDECALFFSDLRAPIAHVMEASNIFNTDAWGERPKIGGSGPVKTSRFPERFFGQFMCTQMDRGLSTFVAEEQMKERTWADLQASGAQIRTNTPLRQVTYQCAYGGRPKLRRSSQLGHGDIAPEPGKQHRRSKSTPEISHRAQWCECRPNMPRCHRIIPYSNTR